MKEKRTKWLALALAGTLLLGLLSACGETEETSADIELDDTVSGETLTAGDQADRVFSLAVDYNQTLNPITTRSQLNQMVGDLVYDRLFDVDENFHVSSRILFLPDPVGLGVCKGGGLRGGVGAHRAGRYPDARRLHAHGGGHLLLSVPGVHQRRLSLPAADGPGVRQRLPGPGVSGGGLR